MNSTLPGLPPELAPLGISALEEWFLARLEEPAPPLDALAAILVSFQERGHTERADTCADFMHDVLAQRGDEEHLLDLWELRAKWHSADPDFAGACAGKLGSVFRDQPRMDVFLRNAGFDKHPAGESLRRLRVLRGLRPGALCWEKTWGLGAVVDIAEFDQQVRIDFEKKKAHRMSLAYAAECLAVLPDDHVLARHRRDPAGFAEWLRDDPAGVVKSALRSFGPLSVPGLQELLAGRVFPEAGWKGFWDAARRQLKNDPRVEFPARRNDPIRLLDSEKKYDGAWLAALGAERDFDRILDQVESWKDAEGPSGAGTIPAEIRDRLEFVIRGADKSQWPQRARALLLAGELGVLDALRDAPAHLAALSDPAIITGLFQQLPIAVMRRLLLFLGRRGGTRIADLLFRILADLPQSAFNEAVALLCKDGAEPRVIDTLRSLMAAGKATPEMVCWLCRHADFARQHGICTMGRLATEALVAAENDSLSGERLKARNQVRSLLEDTGWLAGALGAMDDADRRQFAVCLAKSPAWPAVERHAMIYRLAQAFPELQGLPTAEAAPAPPARRLTSHRSYQERQAQLHKLVTVEIPQNTRDIATARSYGDLSENFEYKSARETQGILMRRRLELETTLHATASTDFEGFPAAAAGMGTCVTIVHADGRRERFAILGEWDNEERLGIISSKSKLAESLNGHHPGDQVSIPAESGSAIVTVAEVSGLTDEIKAWVNGAG